MTNTAIKLEIAELETGLNINFPKLQLDLLCEMEEDKPKYLMIGKD